MTDTRPAQCPWCDSVAVVNANIHGQWVECCGIFCSARGPIRQGNYKGPVEATAEWDRVAKIVADAKRNQLTILQVERDTYRDLAVGYAALVKAHGSIAYTIDRDYSQADIALKMIEWLLTKL